MKRRSFLKASVAGSTLAIAAGVGLLKPSRVWASDWPEASFFAKDPMEAVKQFFGTSEATESSDIHIKAPLQAENGAVVPIKVSTTLAKLESIAIVSEKNPVPMTTCLELSDKTGGFYSARIKMGETSKVSCFVKSDGKLFVASQEIKVTVGGCGG